MSASGIKSEVFIEEDEQGVARLIRGYLSNTQIKNWQTVKVVERILEQYHVQSHQTAVKIIKNEYKTALGDFLVLNRMSLSRQDCAKVQLFKDTACSFVDSKLIMTKLIRAERKDHMDNEYELDMLEHANNRSKRRLDVGGMLVSSSTPCPVPNKRTRISSKDMISELVLKVGNAAALDLAAITDSSPLELRRLKKKLVKRHDLKLAFALTMDEHSVLTRLADGKGLGDLEDIRDELFAKPKDSVTPTIKYIRTALNQLATLYEYRHLVYPAHKEAFFQAHVYANLLDGILLFDPDFRVIRSECNSTVSSKLKAITGMDDKTKARRWDMIYRHLGTKHDVFICEDKPGSATESDVESDRVKCDEQRVGMLRSIVDNLSMEELGAHLEAVTAHTHGLDIVIRGTKKIGEKYVHYTKASTKIPATITSQCAALAEYLMTIISLKRTLMLNFVKLQVASEAVSGYHVMYLSGGEESPDTSPESKDGEGADMKQIMDEQFQNHLKTAKETMEKVVLGDDVLVAKNREILTMLALKKSSNQGTSTDY